MMTEITLIPIPVYCMDDEEADLSSSRNKVNEPIKM